MDNTMEEELLGALGDDTDMHALARLLLEHGDTDHITYAKAAEALAAYLWPLAGLRQPRDGAMSVMVYGQATYEDMVKEDPDGAARCARDIAGMIPNVTGKLEARCGHLLGHDNTGITIPYDARQFLRRRGAMLVPAILLGWARALEEANPGVPGIYDKVEGAIQQKTPASLMKKVLEPHFADCFFCGGPARGRRAAAAHLIPPGFAGADEYWNLVISCKNCAHISEGRLPPRARLNDLFERNSRYQHDIPELKRSANRLGDTETEVARVITGYYDAAVSCGIAKVPYMGRR